MLTTIIIVMVIYFAAMVGIGMLGRKNTNSFDDIVSGGRNSGIIMILGAAAGAHIGNGMVVGGAAEGASVGFSGIAYGVGCCLSYVLIPPLMSKFIYNNGYLSLADYFRVRYTNELPSQLYNFATVFSYLGLIGSQLMAGGALFEALGLNKVLGIVVIALVVFVYNSISGLWGALATSVIQTAIILVGLFLGVFYLFQNNAWADISTAVSAGALPATFTHPWAGYTASALVGMLVPVTLQGLTDQTLFQRICSAKSANISSIGHYAAAILMFPVIMAPVFMGMYGRAKFGATGNAAFFTVVLEVLPPVLAALVVVAVLAAVMSTINGCAMAFPQLVLNDIYKLHINKNATDEQLTKLTLPLNLIVTAICIIFAATASSLLGLLSSSYLFLEGAVLVPLMGGRWYKKGTTQGAIAASIVGMLIAVLEMFGIFALPFSAITMFIPSGIAFVVVSMATQKK